MDFLPSLNSILKCTFHGRKDVKGESEVPTGVKDCDKLVQIKIKPFKEKSSEKLKM